MKDKAIMLTFIVMLVAFAYLLVRVLTFPPPPREVILTGESCSQRMTQLQAARIRDIYENMKKEAGNSHAPYIVAAFDGAGKLLEMLKSTNLQIDQALATRAWPDSLPSLVFAEGPSVATPTSAQSQ